MHQTSWRSLTAALLITLSATAAAETTPPAGAPPAAHVLAAALLAEPPLLKSIGPQAGFGDLLVLGTGGGFELAAAATDHVPVIDGLPVTIAQLAGPWGPGRHAVSLQSVPPPGEPPVVQTPLQFVYDPVPPTIKWEIGTTAMLDVHGLDQGVQRHKPPRHVIPERDRHVKILWSPDGRRWLPLLPKNAKLDANGALADWLTAADRPQVFLWALGSRVFDHGAPLAPKKRQLVRIWAGDELSAVRDLRLRVLPTLAGGYHLQMVATDLVGNPITVTWPLTH